MSELECPICYQTFGHAPGCPIGAEEEADDQEEEVARMDIISSLIHEKIAKNTFNAAAIANGLHFDDLPDDESRLARARLYREWRNAGENRKAAFTRAIRGEPAPSRLEILLAEEHEL